ncbi:unnamed protein product [Sympodiomycopsis kandeliae]
MRSLTEVRKRYLVWLSWWCLTPKLVYSLQGVSNAPRGMIKSAVNAVKGCCSSGSGSAVETSAHSTSSSRPPSHLPSPSPSPLRSQQQQFHFLERIPSPTGWIRNVPHENITPTPSTTPGSSWHSGGNRSSSATSGWRGWGPSDPSTSPDQSPKHSAQSALHIGSPKGEQPAATKLSAEAKGKGKGVTVHTASPGSSRGSSPGHHGGVGTSGAKKSS